MTEKQPFFYKETPQGQRINLQDAFTNALLGDVKLSSPIKTRQSQEK